MKIHINPTPPWSTSSHPLPPRTFPLPRSSYAHGMQILFSWLLMLHYGNNYKFYPHPDLVRLPLSTHFTFIKDIFTHKKVTTIRNYIYIIELADPFWS